MKMMRGATHQQRQEWKMPRAQNFNWLPNADKILEGESVCVTWDFDTFCQSVCKIWRALLQNYISILGNRHFCTGHWIALQNRFYIGFYTFVLNSFLFFLLCSENIWRVKIHTCVWKDFWTVFSKNENAKVKKWRLSRFSTKLFIYTMYGESPHHSRTKKKVSVLISHMFLIFLPEDCFAETLEAMVHLGIDSDMQAQIFRVRRGIQGSAFWVIPWSDSQTGQYLIPNSESCSLLCQLTDFGWHPPPGKCSLQSTDRWISALWPWWTV